MVEPLSLNFRVFTVNLVCVRKLRNFTVVAFRRKQQPRNFEFINRRYFIIKAENNKGADLTAQVDLHLCKKQVFSCRG